MKIIKCKFCKRASKDKKDMIKHVVTAHPLDIIEELNLEDQLDIEEPKKDKDMITALFG